jgi:hypothetical protein
MSDVDPHHAQLEAMAQVAFRLGMAFGHEAEQAESIDRKIEFFHLYDRACSSFRLSIALQLRLKGEARKALKAEREDERPETLERPERPERLERERYDERDRERDRETVSLPALLRALTDVAEGAEALPDPPADLPLLRQLLAQAGAPAPRRTPSATPALRTRLSGSTATLTVPRPSQRAAHPRRATGPP